MVALSTPGDLIKDLARTQFNVGHRAKLTDVTVDEAEPWWCDSKRACILDSSHTRGESRNGARVRCRVNEDPLRGTRENQENRGFPGHSWTVWFAISIDLKGSMVL
jgi:hypothetical protein